VPPCSVESVSGDGGSLRDRSRELLSQLAMLSEDDPERVSVRERLVAQHMPLAEQLAGRFANRGEPYEDLVQVATIGLIKALDRFDPERGAEFTTFATPTIEGEIKQWFRDKGAMVRTPRRLQELRIAIRRARSELTHELGRPPNDGELANRIGALEDDVRAALESAGAYSTVSLDVPAQRSPEDGGSGLTFADRFGSEDSALEDVENRAALRPLLTRLTDRERRIITMTFFDGMAQSQIAAELGISQVHVSRLLARSLARLREGMGDEPA